MRLRITVFHIRVCAAVLGCIILAASFFDRVLLPQSADSGVGVDASSARGPQTAEVWQAAASCTRPFFVKALLQAKAKLKAYYDRAPEEVRAWRNRQTRIDAARQSQEQRGFTVAVKMDRSRMEADAEREAWLYAQHAEWFTTAYKLERDEKQWQRRLENVADQKLVLGASTRKSFSAYAIDDDFPEDGNAFERHVLFLLGLSGFAIDEQRALKSDCVNITPVTKIFTPTSAVGELRRRPFGRIAAFTLGLELLMVSIFFGPIVRWVRSADLPMSANYLYRSTRRLLAGTMVNLQFVFSALHRHLRNQLVPASAGIFALLAAAAKWQVPDGRRSAARAERGQ